MQVDQVCAHKKEGVQLLGIHDPQQGVLNNTFHHPLNERQIPDECGMTSSDLTGVFNIFASLVYIEMEMLQIEVVSDWLCT